MTMSINIDRLGLRSRPRPAFPKKPFTLVGVLPLLLLNLSGCAIVANTPRGSYDRETGAYITAPSSGSPASGRTWDGFTATGQISYYAAKFEGRKTASGERYAGRELTAAHPELPFGVRVKVTLLANGKSVVVRINDRGPFAKGRILDVSYAAAERLGLIQAGIAEARIEVIADD